MCQQNNDDGFVPRLLDALSAEAKLKSGTGKITPSVFLPPRLGSPEHLLVLQALLATTSCVRCNYSSVVIPDDIIETGTDPASIANWLTRISLELANKSGLFRREITAEDFGARRVCLSILLAVLHLFLSFLASIVQANEDFRRRMKMLQAQIISTSILGPN